MAKKIINIVKESIATIIVVCSLASAAGAFTWFKLAVPEIDKRIDIKQVPLITELKSINKALEYQIFIMMEDVADSALAKIDKKYSISQRGKGGKNINKGTP